MLSIRRQWLLWFVLVTLNIAVAPVSRAQFSGFVKPADWGPYNGSVSGSYSTVYRGDYCGGGGGSGSHPGADIFRDRFGADFTAQTQIRAIYAATVVRKTLDSDGTNGNGWGNSLVLRHTGIPAAGDGIVYSAYAHLSDFGINPSTGQRWQQGDSVPKGAVLGFAGDTGDAKGIHLHFQIDLDYPPTDYPLHPFWRKQPSTAKCNWTSTVNTPDNDALVLSHTLNPIPFVEANLDLSSAVTWTPTGSMSAARRDHTATLLGSGKVLIVAGVGAATEPAELYDPGTGSFSLTGNTVFNHGQGSTATRLPDGRVLIVGGGLAQQIAEIYDPSTATLSLTGSPTVPHSYHTATPLPNGKVLIAGGQSNAGIGPVTETTSELYDPITGTFQLTGSLNGSRAGHTATLLPSGKVLIAGGAQTTSPGFAVCLSSTELWDPSTGLFSAGPTMNALRCDHEAVLLANGKVLVLGGLILASAELFDPAANSFSPTGTMATPRFAATATLLPSGRVLVAGGGGAVGVGPTNSAEIYDPTSGNFTATGPMGAARQEHTATLLLDGRVLITGGFNFTNHELNSAELFSSGP